MKLAVADVRTLGAHAGRGGAPDGGGARAIMVNPLLLLLDEPMEGLAPIIVQELQHVIRRLIDEGGMAAIVVEQHARLAFGMTRRAMVLDRGKVGHASTGTELLADKDKLDRLLAVA
jgi:branched-chain amino acid transport system ATP-binding protein